MAGDVSLTPLAVAGRTRPYGPSYRTVVTVPVVPSRRWGTTPATVSLTEEIKALPPGTGGGGDGWLDPPRPWVVVSRDSQYICYLVNGNRTPTPTTNTCCEQCCWYVSVSSVI